MGRAGLAALLLGLAAPIAAGQDDPTPYRLGFEERPIRDIVVPGWEMVREPGFPAYNRIEVVRDRASARSGDHYLRLQTDGGNTGLEMRVSTTREVSDLHSYSAEAFVRLRGTGSNSAVLSIRWLDSLSRPLAESRSPPLSAAPDWTPVRLQIRRILPGVRWAQIRLLFEGTDYRGDCHFDDLSLTGHPRIEVAPANRRVALFHEGEPARFEIRVPALGESSRRIVTSVVDSASRTVVPEESSTVSSDLTTNRSFALPAGSYEMATRVTEGDRILSEQIVPFVVLGDPAPPSGGIFGIVLNPWRGAVRDAAAFATALGAQRSKIVLWDRPREGRDLPPQPDEIHSLVRSLIEANAPDVTGVFADPPPDRFPGLDPGTLRYGPMALFSLRREAWEKETAEEAARYGEWIFLWQVGADDDRRGIGMAGTREALSSLRNVLRGERRISSVGLPVPYDAVETFANPGAETLSVHLPADADPSTTPLTQDRTYVLDVPPPLPGPREAARQRQTAEFLRRAIELVHRVGTAGRIYVPLLQDDAEGLLDFEGNPRAPFLALRSLNALLSGTVPVPGFHVFQPPVQDRAFSRGEEILVAFWSLQGEVVQELFLGPDAKIADPLGIVSPLPPGSKVVAGPVPKFLMGIDPFLLQTQMSLQFFAPDQPEAPDPSLPLRNDSVTKILRFKNHFRDEISGLRIAVQGDRIPPHWLVEPRTMTAAVLPAGATFEQEIKFTLPPTEREGFSSLFFDLSFKKGSREYALQVERVLEVKPDIGILIRQEAPDPARPESRRITIDVENRTKRTVTLVLQAQVPGQTDRPMTKTGIPPGGGLKPPLQFYIEDIGRIPAAHRQIRVAVQETVGRTFANKVESLR